MGQHLLNRPELRDGKNLDRPGSPSAVTIEGFKGTESIVDLPRVA